jgi:transcription initiation factor TFIIE subunit beta
VNNEKIIYKNGKFSYKPIYNVKSKSDLLRLLMRFRDIEGLDSKDIKESYSGASSAIQELKDSNEILTVHNSDCNSEILFYNDQTLEIPMDPEFRQFWREVPVPDEVDLDKQLRRGNVTESIGHGGCMCLHIDMYRHEGSLSNSIIIYQWD